MAESFELIQGELPVLVSLPHTGTDLLPGMAERLTPEAALLPDTDWFVDRLYARVLASGVSVIKPVYSRYVVDLNRPADDHSLYPGQNTTGLCPVTTFQGGPVYKEGMEPDAKEREWRREQFWQPYHNALSNELTRLRSLHSEVLLWDAHSIFPVIPALFEGRLPDLNIGTNGGLSCTAKIEETVCELAAKTPFTSVCNGRFKGGFITRNYGQPEKGINALQLEMATSAYMEDGPPYLWNEERAETMALVVERLVTAAAEVLST